MRLEKGLELLGVETTPDTFQKLNAYLEALATSNKVFNLISRKSQEEAVTRHVLDSLTILPSVRGDRLLDVGTGAGLPGLMIAIVAPSVHCTLLDSNGKKARFCYQTASELGLQNVEVANTRLDAFEPEKPFSTVVSRAFGPAANLLASTRRLCGGEGRIICMKGTRPTDELDALGSMKENAHIERVEVPGLVAERHLLIIDLPQAGTNRVS
jgi:16S rRNA (guanine527-N7)-methyltransferase